MNKLFIFFLLLSHSIKAQIIKPSLPDSLFSTYYHQRVTHFRSLPQTTGDIVFAGNSITDGAEWYELFNDIRIKNRGISGDVSAGIINRIDEITNRRPAKVFLMIGVNDLAKNVSPDSLVKNILWTTSYIRQQSSSTQVYVQSILPVNEAYGMFETHTSKGDRIKKVNVQLQQNASAYHYTYIDLYSHFADHNGKLDVSLTNDGLHLKGEAYLLWKHLLYPYVFGLNEKPALIPLPQLLQWKDGRFPLYLCKTILVKNKALQKEAELLQQKLQAKGLAVKIANTMNTGEPFIELTLDKVDAPQLPDEAYQLKVSNDKVSIGANTAHGIFNAVQTLVQLMRDGTMISACDITDWPAYAWRGYMVDVGRNYQSIELLTQQIDIMSHYKLNIFQFHFTEDIAWRLSVKQYPQLTAPENMLRDKGLYYTEEELKNLIAYCKERYITLIPEIDMPGHSAAFTRAMKTGMQSDTGLAIVKNILTTFCTTYDVPYVHIGGDEVRITNKNFIPEITKLINSLGKKTIGWSPGADLDKQTIRQLWMGDKVEDTTLPYIDSRHLYINHMDPLESVETIFNRQIGSKTKGDELVKGGILCLWHDRRIAKEDDVLRMNPAYPAMLAFAERSWRGGGYREWITNININDTGQLKAFENFEQRLTDHRQQYFSTLPFPYIAQSQMRWNLFGPYENNGDLFKAFEPEKKNFDADNTSPALQAAGGTVVLRHWWYPLIKAVINQPKENSTWYATTKIWSDEDKLENFWIGFNNLSRSPATDTPKPGTWDDHQSMVWVNETLVPPPVWKRGGQKGNSEIPLIDEGYEYREPTKILLHKGWNRVLVKAPIGIFKAIDWQNPVKWMFTFVPSPAL